MTAQNRTTLYTYFTTNAKPTQAQFANLIDSNLNIATASGQSIAGDVSAQGKFEVRGDFTVSGAATVSGNTAITGNTSVGGTFSVSATSTFGQTVTLSNSANASISGNLSVTGPTTLANASANVPSAGDTSGSVATMKNFTQGANGSSEVLINATAASNNASITLGSIPSGYDQYELRITNLLPATNGTNITVRVGTPSPLSTNYSYSGNSSSSVPAVTPFGIGGGSGTAFPLSFSGILNTSLGLTGKYVLTSLGAALDPTYHGMSRYNTNTTFYVDMVGGFCDTSNVAATALQIIASAGNLTSGTIALYGIRKT